jgi:hypothetical protein
MDQVKRPLIWLVRAFLGYAAIATPTFALLYWTLGISIKQLLPPYFLMFGFLAVSAMMMFNARKYRDQPNVFCLRFSVATFFSLFTSLAVIYYFGTKDNVIRPDSPGALITIGVIGVVGVSVGMFYYSRRWLHLRNSEK